MQLFLGLTWTRTLRHWVYNADNFRYFGGEVPELYLKPDNQKSQHIYFGCRPENMTGAGFNAHSAVLVQQIFRSSMSCCILVWKEQSESNLVACNDVHGLVTDLNISQKPEKWWLVTAPSKLNSKAVLLHNGKMLQSITVRYAFNKKTTYNNINSKKYQWQLCGYLKVAAIRGGVDMSLARTGRNKLQQPNSGFIQHNPHEAQYTS